MKLNIRQTNVGNANSIQSLIHFLSSKEDALGLKDASLYCDFPVYKNIDEDVIIAQLILLSKKHGVILFRISDVVRELEFDKEKEIGISYLDELYSLIFARLIRNKNLKEGRNSLITPIKTVLYAPLLAGEHQPSISGETDVIYTSSQLESYLASNINEIDSDIYDELIATTEGAKGLIIPKKRANVVSNSKGDAINELEKEIAKFDEYQRIAFSSLTKGVSRIRGLAGSGKTVILCLKAAVTHLREPDAKIVYTFYTKSLYQHVQRLITRFYRQFDDKDPNWDNLIVMHAWGNSSNEGVYTKACSNNGIIPMSFVEAQRISKNNPFDAVCSSLLSQISNPAKSYDYVFIDEGQDFPTSFLKLCIDITRDQKVVFAYDDLQTIFQNHAPTSVEIFGTDAEGNPLVDFTEDIVLYKCYRNPREIILTAHALGFGIYTIPIVQMIESEDYWRDIGYEIHSGELIGGRTVEILRPKENSLVSISNKYNINEIIQCNAFSSFEDEIFYVCENIAKDIKNGLLPEDILVITVDDRNASTYLNAIEKVLAKKHSIKSNNIHVDKFSIKDFQVQEHVTLSTIHKAKGNEAYSVYVVGVDSLYTLKPSVRERNILFTAMTRAKGWVNITGVGAPTNVCCEEIEKAKQNFPYLKFTYPSKPALRTMKRDMREEAINRSKNKRKLDDILSTMSIEEIEMYLEQKKMKG